MEKESKISQGEENSAEEDEDGSFHHHLLKSLNNPQQLAVEFLQAMDRSPGETALSAVKWSVFCACVFACAGLVIEGCLRLARRDTGSKIGLEVADVALGLPEVAVCR